MSMVLFLRILWESSPVYLRLGLKIVSIGKTTSLYIIEKWTEFRRVTYVKTNCRQNLIQINAPRI